MADVEIAGPYAADFDPLAFHHLNPERYPYLLQSSVTGPQGRFDILLAFPGERLTLRRGHLTGPHADSAGFLAALDAWWQSVRTAPATHADAPLPFLGGWFVFLAYELAQEIEPRLALAESGHTPLTAVAVRCPAAVIVDRWSAQSWYLAESEHADLLDLMRADRARLGQAGTADPETPLRLAEQAEEPADVYVQAVSRALDYIRDGDIFQANLSRLWQTRLQVPLAPDRVYARLRRHNPGPFNGLAVLGDYAIVSSSPERLVEVRGERVATRPIAGTRPRGMGEADAGLSSELLAHPKERAEHVMLIDLERNDLGRVCRPGSIRVDEMMTLESYAHVHHIVSNVTGRLRPEITPGEVIRAVFPGGTITGCPKVRCMEIIAELEQQGRGAYTGSMGYLNRNGDMDLNILIRTMEQQAGRLYWRAGAGIVADSDPGRELQETRDKARGLVLALGGD